MSQGLSANHNHMFQHTNYYYLAVFLLGSMPVQASLHCDRSVAQILSAQGKVDAQRGENAAWLDVHQQEEFCPGDKIRTAKRSRATLRLSNESVVTLEQTTTVLFPEPAADSPKWLVDLLNGVSFFRSRQPQQLHIKTPFINAVHEGTEFLVSVDGQHTEITVFDGQVAGQNQAGRIQIKPGFTGVAESGRPPRIQALTIRPEDAVQWALYYPPLVDGKPGAVQPAALTKVPELLQVGRVDEAQAYIAQLLKIDAQNSDALAYQAIIAIAKNRHDDALALATKAITYNPSSVTAKLALSYVYQASSKLDGALKTTLEAAQLAPDNALIWARLAELQLSDGNRDEALQSAQKAQVLNPQLARTQSVLGFAHLSQTNLGEARRTFDQAVSIDSSDPLAWLGLGLTDIRSGQLEQGIQKLEAATNLDPNNAVIRSYLGKAHYEAKNNGYAATEFKIAKASDPKDPTPWFYDAILKQTSNQPVAALQDMQQAVALNDNRAVYRSRLLLDKDAAVRGTGLGRIYNDLGFNDVANRQAIKSLALDPSNYSAHRLLADSAVNQPRQEITRASALLQSQLFQSVNLNPIQPRLAYTDLNIAKSVGPAEIGFNEYNKAFERDNIRLTNTTSYGSNNTVGNEAVISGLVNKFSYSLGQLHYDTDGYRTNSGIKHDLYNAFVQYDMSPKFNIQAEYRRRDTVQGDLELKGWASEYNPDYRRDLGQDTYRLGTRFSPSQHSHFLTSFIYAKRSETLIQASDLSVARSDEGYQLESAYLYEHERFNIMFGGGRYAYDIQNQVTTSNPFLCFILNCQLAEAATTQNFGYTYANIKLLNNLTGTLGLSYDSYNETEGNSLSIDRFNPKFGLLWQATEQFALRLAVFETLKSPMIVNQMLQPLQMAGFNQFFDDPNGTKALQYGLGADYRFNSNWYTGVEAYKRELDTPYVDEGGINKFEQRTEDLYRFYVNWAVHENWVVSSGVRYENFNGDGTLTPKTVKTAYLPTSLRFFHPTGLFAELRGTYVNQQVDRPALPTEQSFASDFYIVDVALGYRFPKQYGLISLEANNLLDNRFRYRDRKFQMNEQRASDITPEQTLFARFTFNF